MTQEALPDNSEDNVSELGHILLIQYAQGTAQIQLFPRIFLLFYIQIRIPNLETP